MITSYDTQTIGNSAIQQLVRQEIERQNAQRDAETAAKLAEQEKRIAELEERLKSKSARVDALCGQMLDALPAYYPDPEPGSRLGDALWGLIGLALLAFDRWNAKAVRRWYP